MLRLRAKEEAELDPDDKLIEENAGTWKASKFVLFLHLLLHQKIKHWNCLVQNMKMALFTHSIFTVCDKRLREGFILDVLLELYDL